MTYEYHVIGPDKDGDYECQDCGHYFTPTGEPVECPICKQINEGPKLKPCPFCGHTAVLDWEIRNRDMDDRHQIQARCMGCGAETDLYDTAMEAASRWNRRADSESTDGQGLKSCPFCGGPATIRKVRNPDEEDKIASDAYNYVAVCTGCGNRSERSDEGYDEDREQAIEGWNRRAEP